MIFMSEEKHSLGVNIIKNIIFSFIVNSSDSSGNVFEINVLLISVKV